MKVTIIWSNPSRNLIARAEFGKGMSFKNKLGCKPANLKRSIVINLPEKINIDWKRALQSKINEQFQQDRKATIYFTGFKGDGQSCFVVSARNAKNFSNKVANGILRMRGALQHNIIGVDYKPLGHIK